MRSYFKGAMLALVALLVAGPADAIDEFFPDFGNAGYDVIHYDLDLDVSVAPHHLNGRARLVIEAERDLSQLTLDLAGLNVRRVRINGFRAKFAQADGKLIVRPRHPIHKGRIFLLSVDYGGTPQTIQDPTAPDDPSIRLGWFSYQDSTYVVSEPVGASTFFPANDEPTDKASFTIAVTVPAGYTAAANGVLVSRRERLGKRRFVWQMRDPMTTWLATVHVNQFRMSAGRSRTGVPLRFYTTEATPEEDRAGYALSGKMIPYFEKLAGRYPFDSYGSVVVDDPALYYALETQAMSTFPLGAADEAIVAHELAHQWFGNSVSVAQWRDLWIGEGFATYFEVLWPNRADEAAFDAKMRGLYEFAVDRALGPAVVEAPEQIFSDRTYVRGALALYALQLQVGEKTFFRIVRTFATKYRGGNVTSRDFIGTAVEVSRDPAVEDLLEAWLYGQDVPALPGSEATVAAKRQGNVPVPDLVGLRCKGGAHRSDALAHCQ
jgi:aminopeptidase N